MNCSSQLVNLQLVPFFGTRPEIISKVPSGTDPELRFKYVEVVQGT